MPIKLAKNQLFQVLPILAKNLHNVFTTHHAEQRMIERNISYDDCLDAISNPCKLIDIRLTDQGDYAYKIAGKESHKHVVLVIKPAKRQIHIVTVINTVL